MREVVSVGGAESCGKVPARGRLIARYPCAVLAVVLEGGQTLSRTECLWDDIVEIFGRQLVE